MFVANAYVTVLMGRTIPTPLPAKITEVIHSIEVVQRDQNRSGFRIEFYAGRQGVLSQSNYALLQSPLLKTFNRVQILVTLNGRIRPLIDGIITEVHLENLDPLGGSKVVVTGQDVSFMMDRKEVQMAYPAQPEAVIVAQIIGQYAKYQIVPNITPPPLNVPNVTDWIPRQYGTDYVFLRELAQRFGYVFNVLPGPTPGVNTAYWGPSKRAGVPQPALTAGTDFNRNVEEIVFKQNALSAETVVGKIQDRETQKVLPVNAIVSTKLPLSTDGTQNLNAKQLLIEDQCGLTYSEVFARAQGITNQSRDRVIVAEGTLNSCKYGAVLQINGLIGVQGAGLSYDGLYYVEQVVHTLGMGYYRQQFRLTRDGTGTTVPAVLTV